MQVREIILFGTSEIQTTIARGPVKGKLSDGTEVKSTCLLERALERGHQVMVVTTRPKFDDHDKWWIELVGKDQIFMPQKRGTCAGDPVLREPWVRAFAHLGLNVDPDKFSNWMQMRDHLVRNDWINRP